LHQHRQRRRRRRLRGAQSELRLQRRDPDAGRDAVVARRRAQARPGGRVSDTAQRPGLAAWLLRDLPYAAMLALALGGAVLTSFRGAGTYYYWMALAPVYGLICVGLGWRQLDTGNERLQLALTQVLHWVGILAAMWLMFLPQVRGIENDNATSLTLLILLA